MDIVERLSAGKCPECSGWGEVAHFGEMVACKCNGRYERPISMEERTEAAETILALRAALEPFAAMGRVMEIRARVTFGKMPKDSEIVCESSGEAGMGILTMGHFRDAAATLPDAPGWGGIYKPLPIRAAHQGTEP